MPTEATTQNRFRLFPAPPAPRLAGEWFSTADPTRWPLPPTGDGRPAMLIPGFLAGDVSLRRMALWLRSGGYELTRSGIRWNTGCMDDTIEGVARRLRAVTARAGRPALVVGQSRGGSIGRAVATLYPDLVDTLVTLGSPLLDPLAVHTRVWPSIMTVGTLGSIGVPGMFSFSCISGDCCQDARRAHSAPWPEHVRFVSLYSRSDEIVRWEACLDPAAEHVEVDSSHIGMGMAREVWRAVARTLSRP
jgi:pimeloyl-ACP methyl ester carboxylesterase